MIVNDTQYMTDQEFRILVCESRKNAYLMDLEELDLKIYFFESMMMYLSKDGDTNTSHYYWVIYCSYCEVYDEKEKQRERSKKIGYALDEDSDPEFITSISIESLFGE